MVSSKSFCFKFSTKSFIHFLLIFVCGVKYVGPVLFFHMWVSSFSQHHLLKRLSFSLWMVLAPLSEIIWTHVSISGLSVLFHWSVCLSVCHYSTVLITLISLEVNFEIWKCEISNLFFFSIVLVIWSLLRFHVNFRVGFSVSGQKNIGIW